jgi:sterol desaturase/sphingolipid hydroxylase (fatty acid hydroxylase superfamily)
MKRAQICKYIEAKHYDGPIDCIIIFLVIFIPLLLVSCFLKYYSDIIFQFALFFTGWVGWTFSEYMAHRYLMHSSKEENRIIDFNHAHHHTHPTDIKISGTKRGLLVIGCIILLIISGWLDNYFTLVAGFLCGLPAYTLMHFFIHQKTAQKIFTKHVKYHIWHHCKYPDKCFGISVTWWDDLFKTIPLNPGVISQRIIDFYLMHETEKSRNLHPGKYTKTVDIHPS